MHLGRECLIGLTKAALKITVGRANVLLIVLETLVEEEAVLNDRTLTCTSSEYNMDPLTPAHSFMAE